MSRSVDPRLQGAEGAPSPIDVAGERARLAAPLIARHLNSAGASLPTAATLAAVLDHLRLEARVGGYEAAATARERLDAVYGLAAGLLGAAAADIAQVESATVGWQRAVDALGLAAGDRVIAARSSYVSSALNLLELARVRGVEVEILPSDELGRVDLVALEAALQRPAALVTVAHLPTSSGLVEPVAAVGALARAAGVPYLLDATQSVGQLPIDVEAIGCDLLVTTGRKFLRGPRGTGLLYVSAAMRDRLRPLTPDVRGSSWTGERSFDLSDAALRFETWEASHALRLGLGVALAEASALGVPAIAAHVGGLASTLRERLRELPGVTVTDPQGAEGGGIVTFVRDGEPAQDTQATLHESGIHVTAVPASHGQWDLGHRGLTAIVRTSFHVYNDLGDVEALVDTIAETGRTIASRPAGFTAAPARDRITRAARVEAAYSDRADVIVVGAGVHGRATAWQLAQRGLRVIQLDSGRDGHDRGSSHGRTRMIRRAYPSPVWDGFVDLAYAGWADLEAAAGQSVVTTTGGLYARPLGAEGTLRGPGCEPVDLETARRISPGLALEDGFSIVHDPAAGIIDARSALTTMRQLGIAHGVDVREATPVLGWESDGDGVAVDTPGGRLLADRLVVCAGAWTGDLLPGFAPLLQPTRIVNVHFTPLDLAAVSPPALGPFAIDVPGVGLLYGIPAFDGAGLKVGLDHGPPIDPRRAQPPVSPAEIEPLVALVERFLPLGAGAVEEVLSCVYTMAPSNRFAIGALPDAPQVLVGAACSGHGFKFGPAVGAALADLATGIARPDLDFLDPARMLGVAAQEA
jgi:selenocysteine lyase/cysteine desulfurase/glycine/D-amino acid oxidase-like deaminating enzyme